MSYPWGGATTRRVNYPARLALRPRALRLMVALAVVAAAEVYDAGRTAQADPPPLGTLPVFGANPVVTGTVRSIDVNGTLMRINQESLSAHLRALSFNLASNAHLNVNQEAGAASRTLIQIDPASGISQVYGRITAQGQLILFNRAGMVFGGTSVIDTRSLVATALDPRDVSELLGRFIPIDQRNPVFQWTGTQQEFEATQILVEQGARLRSNAPGGSVMLFAPKVVNEGTIHSPDGQIILAAGARVYLAFEGNPDLRGFLVEVDPYTGTDAQGNPIVIDGEVTNERLGQIIAERGNVTMAGYAMNQRGVVRATTAVNSNGSIILKAGDTPIFETDPITGETRLAGRSRPGTLTLGEGSVTEILPELGDRATIPAADVEAVFNRSYIELAGGRIELLARAQVRAPGGEVLVHTLSRNDLLGSVLDGLPGTTDLIYLGLDSVIDVSGIEQYLVDMERNFIPVKLFGNELKDTPPQRDDFLYRQEVWIDIRRRYQVADFSGYVAQVGRTVGELSTEGGTITLRTLGAVVTRPGSLLDVSGGSVRYTDGYGRTTQLVDTSGRIYDIAAAPLNNRYVGVADTVTRVNRKFGFQQVWGIPGSGVQLRRYGGYVEGRNGGALNILASAGAYEGALAGHVTYTAEQRYFDSLPLATALRIGNFDTDVAQPDYRTPDIVIDPAGTVLPAGFNADTAAQPGGDWRATVKLSSNILSASGFGDISLASNGEIHLTEDARLDLTPGARLSLKGHELDIEGDVIAPSGVIDLQTVDIGAPDSASENARHRLRIGPHSLLSTAGLWVNEWALAGYSPATIRPIHGGRINIASTADAMLEAGSVLDVSGGAAADSRGRLQAGSGGGISISVGRLRGDVEQDRQTSQLQLDSELRGYGLTSGGTLSVSATRVRVGGAAGDDPLEWHASEDFFRRGGFRSFSVNGQDGLTVVTGARVHPVMTNFILPMDMLFRTSGGGLYGVAGFIERPSYTRAPASLALSANSKYFGNLRVAEGAVLRIDPGGAITLNAGRQLTVLGALAAPAGTITLVTADPVGTASYVDSQSIWLGSAARLLAGGAVVLEPNDNGLRTGRVLNGGSVNLLARSGFIVTEEGSLIDVSGVSTELDLPAVSSPVRERVTVNGDAGAISLRAREGMLLDGSYQAQAGGPGSRGGTIDIEVSTDLTDVNPLPSLFPNAFRVVRLREGGNSIPAGLRPGDTIESKNFADSQTLQFDPYQYVGKAQVAMDRIRSAGFDSLTVRADHRIEFTESFTGQSAIAFRRNLVLDAPVIVAAQATQIELSAAYAALAGFRPLTESDNRMPRDSDRSAGTADFTLHARHIDLIGHVGLDGMDEIVLDSEGDIRAVAVPTGTNITGSLASMASSLTLRGRQVYPVTFADFNVRLIGPHSQIRIERSGDDTLVLSAGGRIAFSALTIEQAGAVKAPFGEIVFDAGRSLELVSGSLTSVSGEGQLIPFGRTLVNGELLVYDIDGSIFNVITAPPQKSVVLHSPAINVAPGATVDLRGGGDLVSYEFTPGPPGRSIDILDPSRTGSSFAILPLLNSEFASYDTQYYLGSRVMPGESIYLAEVPGVLSAGVYAKLPARYALLDGALLVTPVAGSTDAPLGSSSFRPDGTRIVGGYNVSRAVDLDTFNAATVNDARRSAFTVKSSDQVRWESDYRLRNVSEFFAGNAAFQSPNDAGRLVIDATSAVGSSALSFAGTLRADPAPGGRGGEVDITANQIAIAAPGTASIDGFVRIDPETMRSLSNASLMIGGTREASADGVIVNVRAQNVVIANSETQPLEAPEILLVASDTVNVRSGSVVRATGSARLNNADLILLAEDINATPGNASDDVARRAGLLRVSVGDQVGMRRPGPLAQANNGGSVVIESGATVSAARSAILDATQSLSNAGALRPGRSLAVGAPRINLGNGVPTGASGLTLAGDNLTSLYAVDSAVDTLTLRSYTSIDLYDDVDVPSRIRDITLEAPQIRGFGTAGTTTAVRVAGTLRIANFSGGQNRAAATGASDLLLSADESIRFGDGTVKVDGFANVALSAGQQLRIEGNGQFDVAAPLTITTPRITAASGTDYKIRAVDDRNAAAPVWYTLNVNNPQSANQTAINDLGARIDLFGRSVTLDSVIATPAGRIGLHAMGSDATDDVTLGANARILVHGVERRFADVARYAPGGEVILESAHGDIGMDATAEIDISGRGDADSGLLSVSAVNGTATLDGQLVGSAAAGADPENEATGGRFHMDVGSIADWSSLNIRLNSGGFSGGRDFRVRTGDITIGAGETVTAHELRVAADNGSIGVAGTIDASGRAGGRVELWAGNSVTLARGSYINASAHGTDQNGGTVILGARTGTATLEADETGQDNGARINVAGTGTALDVNGSPVAVDRGTVWVRVPRSVDNADFAAVTLSDNIVGAREIVIEPVRSYAATSITSAAQWNTDNGSFVNAPAVAARINALRSALGAVGTALHLRPGVEVTSSGNLALDVAAGLDLHTFRYSNVAAGISNESGVLTLRAAGNLVFNQSLSDGFSNAATSGILQAGGSWSYRLVAGADAAGATPMSVRAMEDLSPFLSADTANIVDRGNGNIIIGSGQRVRTGIGFIEAAAGRDVVLWDAGSVLYTAGVPTLNPEGFSPTAIRGGGTQAQGVAPVYPTDGGSVRVTAQGTIFGRAPGVNASGRVTNQTITDWLFREGRLNSSGLVSESISWYPRFDRFKQGIGTLGGGDVFIEAGGNIDNLSAVVSTSGRLRVAEGSAPEPDQLEVLGGGDLLARAGGDILGGMYYVGQGTGRLLAGGRVGANEYLTYNNGSVLPRRTMLALGDARIAVQAVGDTTVGALFNPTLVPQVRANFFRATTFDSLRRTVFSTYTTSSAVSLSSLTGDIELAPDQDLMNAVNTLRQVSGSQQQYDWFDTNANVSSLTSTGQPSTTSFLVMPPSLATLSFDGDVVLNSNQLTLFPATTGNLDLLAAGSVQFGTTKIIMSDADPTLVAPYWRPDTSYNSGLQDSSFRLRVMNALAESTGEIVHASSLLHAGDTAPIRIVAQTGDIVYQDTTPQGFAKASLIYAGRDIRNFRFAGQHANPGDVTRILAGRDVVFDAVDPSTGAVVSAATGITVAGEGRVEVIAGRDINLGASTGILTGTGCYSCRKTGDDYNPFLPRNGADITVIAGMAQPPASGAFINRYLDTASAVPEMELPAAERSLYQSWMQAYVSQPGDVGVVDPPTALARLRAMAPDQQRSLLQRIVLNEIVVTGDIATDKESGVLFNDYTRAYRAIAILFPGPDGRWPARGDINLFFSQIKTLRGGDIQLWAPGGEINAGLATSSGLSKEASDLGIVTLSGGNISAVVGGDFLVNQSRVFTLQGGDLLLWSSDGDIDAGRGAKTSSSTVPPRLRLSADGLIEYDVTGAVAGSGIAVLKANPDVVPGKLRLFAPRGTIRAGDAGIRAFDATFGGNIEGGDNINIGGKTNIQLNPNAGVGSDVTGAGDAAGTATKGSEDSMKAARNTDDEGVAAFLDVEVVGFGEGVVDRAAPSPSSDQRERKKP